MRGRNDYKNLMNNYLVLQQSWGGYSAIYSTYNNKHRLGYPIYGRV